MKASDHTPRDIAPARVLFKKFPLATTISALAMASMIVLGGALSAEAEDVTYTPTTRYEISGNVIYCGFYDTNNYNKDSYGLLEGGNFITDGKGEGYVFGTYGAKAGGTCQDVANNTLIVKNLTATDAFGALAQRGSATYNTVTVLENTSFNTVVGGAINTSYNEKLGLGNAEYNTAIFDGGSTGKIEYFGGARVNNGSAKLGHATGNKAIMNSGTAIHVYGALVRGAEGTATYNTVEINGGTAERYIFGGISVINATNNTVTLSGSPKLDSATILGGCKSVFASNTDNFDFSPDSIGNPDFRKGNTLHVKTLGLTATNIHNFENYQFTLPNTVKNGDIALQLTDTAGTDLGADPKVDVVIEAGAPLVIEGGRADLIRNNNGLEYSGKLVLAPEADSTPPAEGDIPAEGDTPAEGTTPVAAVTARQGVSLEYDLVVGTDAESLYVTVTVPQPEEPTQPEEPGQPEAPAPVPPVPPAQPAVRVNPQTKSLLEGRIASLAFVNQGADLIAGRGIAAAREASLEGELVPFMIGEAGKSRYQTGSHVDVRGFSMIAGLTYGKKTEIGDATLAAFFEGGWGNYDSHNSFHNAASVRGDGNNKYYGGGMLAHMAFPDLGPGNVYAEATFRAGWADTDYSSGDLRDAFGNQAAYSSGAAYWGAHVGLGYEWKLSDSSLLDFYAKYFWTHHTGDSVNVVGDPIDFGASNSHRSRFGARYTKEIVSDGMVFKPFVGAAYEYEFNGKASGTTYGFAMDEPALRGGTGMGEVGMTFKPAEDSDFELDLSLQGYTGTREGVAGTFTLKYKF